MPLPLISARLPSAFQRCITTSTGRPSGAAWPAVGRAPRIRPSAPRPRRRSQSGAGQVGVAVERAVDLLEGDQEVVAEAVVLGELHAFRSGQGRCPGRAGSVSQDAVEAGERVLPTSGSSRRRNPLDAGIAAEPALLAAGEPAGAAHGVLDGLVEGCAVLEVVEQLAVAERLARRAGEPGRAAQQRARPRRGTRPRAGPRSGRAMRASTSSGGRPRGRRAGTATAGRCRGRARRTRTADRCRRSPRGPARPGDGWSAPCAPRRPGRGRCEPGEEGGRCRRRPRARPAPSGNWPGISRPSTTACRYSPVPPTRRARRPRASMSASTARPSAWNRDDGVVVVGVDQVEQVVGHLGLLGRGGLGRADVHAPVHLHGVDGDDLDVAAADGPGRGPAPTCPRRSDRRSPGAARTAGTSGRRRRSPGGDGDAGAVTGGGEDLDQLAPQEVGTGAR